MSFFEINGLAVPVEKFAENRDRVLGSVGRNALGDGTAPDGKNKRKFDVTLQLMDLSTAQAWAGLLGGSGHSISFDASLYSADGLGPDTGYTTSLSTTVKFGARSCYVYSGRTATWQLVEWGSYTISAWGYSSAWHHIAIIDGTKYVDGSVGSFTDLAYSGGALTLTGSTYSRIDDAVIYPGAMPIATVQAMHAQAFSDLPQVLLSGDAIGSEAAFLASDVKVVPVKGPSKARVQVRFDEV